MFEPLKTRGAVMDRWRVTEADIKHHPGFSPIDVSYENAWNVVGSFRPQKEAGRSLILTAHVDVVPTGHLRSLNTPVLWLFVHQIPGTWAKAGMRAKVFIRCLVAIKVVLTF